MFSSFLLFFICFRISKKEFENQIIASLTWLNLKWDSKIFTQSKNKKLHSDTIASLLETKKAYKCFCSHEEIEKLRKTTNYNGFRCQNSKK